MLRQTERLLAALQWTGGEAVFGEVSAAASPEGLDRAIMPVAIVNDNGFLPHDEHAELGWFSMEILVATVSRGDQRGRGALMGHGAVADSSKGRGLKQLQNKVLEAVKQLGDTDGIVHIGHGGPWSAPVRGVMGKQDRIGASLNVSVFIGNDASYPPPSGFEGEFTPSTSATLTWTLPASRFDRVGVHIRRKTGSAPTSVTDGTAIYTGAASEFEDEELTPGTTYYYAIWGAYDSTYQANDAGAATPDAYSDPLTTSVFIGIS